MPKQGPHRHPRRGSLMYWPRVRAKRIYPRIRSWPKTEEVRLLGFCGYKVGMTHVIAIDNSNSHTKGEEIFIPVTVLETPPIFVFGIRLYKRNTDGSLSTLTEYWCENLPKYLDRKIPTLPKEREMTLEKLEEKVKEAYDVRVLIATNPHLTGIGKKKPEVMEIAIGGKDVREKFEYAKKLLGRNVEINEVFKPGEQVDVIAVTKGKGYQGVVKRFGVKLLSHKSEKSRRKVGCLSPQGYGRTMWQVPQSGQMGYHTRTEYNKWILMIKDIKELDINPPGGWLRYGLIRNKYVVLAGSVPGPQKRLIRLRLAIRPNKYIPSKPPEIVYIDTVARKEMLKWEKELLKEAKGA